jgi:multiple sugar transport system permease protein
VLIVVSADVENLSEALRVQGSSGTQRVHPVRPGWRRRLRRLWSFRTLCLAPAIVYIIVLFGYPVFYNVRLGFYQEDGAQFITNSAVFVGLSNYRQLFHDGVFISSLGHTLLFAAVTIPAQFGIGLLIALLLNRQGLVYSGIRALLLLPWLLPLIVTGNVFIWMLDGFYGVINYLLVSAHITSHYVPWLSEPSLALWSVIIANTWLGIPFNVIIIYAGLRSIPKELYEAARVDGAGAVRVLRSITIPLLRDVIAVLLILGIIYSVKLFDVVWIMTRGGPANSTQVMGTVEYQDLFTLDEFGYGAAIANVMLVLAAIGGLMYVRLARGRSQVEPERMRSSLAKRGSEA